MSHHHFNVQDDSSSSDGDGTTLAGIAEAKHEAVRHMGWTRRRRGLRKNLFRPPQGAQMRLFQTVRLGQVQA